MSIWNRRPAEDVDTERARLMARADAASHEEMVRRIQRNAARDERAVARQTKRTEILQKRKARAQKLCTAFENSRRRMILVLPLLGVNILALGGQIGFATKHLGWNLPEAVLFGAVLESIAVYIGWHAHQALLSGDSAIKLRASSYLMGAIVGGLNYEHFAGKSFAPSVSSVVFGLMSLTSPWLWAMHGRHANRIRLRELGLIDERAPHFAGGRWLHFPVQTWGALRWGIAHNVQDPAAAWDGYQRMRRVRAESKDSRPQVRVMIVRETTRTVAPQRPRLRLYRISDQTTGGLSAIGTTKRPGTNDQRPVTNERPRTGTPSGQTNGQANDRPTGTPTDRPETSTSDRPVGSSKDRPAGTRKTSGRQKRKPSDEEENQRARAAYLQSAAEQRLLTERELADMFGRSKGWARTRIQEAGPQPVGGARRAPASDPKDHPETSEVRTG